MPVPKNYSEFTASLTKDSPSLDWPDNLKAMWYDCKDDWESAHDIAQEMLDAQGSWIHAYLHRKEGDRFNAGYWYRQAGREFPHCTLQEEQYRLVIRFLDRHDPKEQGPL